jgi:hypothetical protein
LHALDVPRFVFASTSEVGRGPPGNDESTIAPRRGIPHVTSLIRWVLTKNCPDRATGLGDRVTWHFMPG